MDFHDISLLLRSHTPILVIETHEEGRAIALLSDIADNMKSPVFKWSVATGMQRMDVDLEPQVHLKEPTKLLQHISSARFEGIYVLLDFHPYLEDPVNVRLLKELAIEMRSSASKLVLVSHKISIPPEVKKMAENVELSMPDEDELLEIVKKEASDYASENANLRVSSDRKVLQRLISNLKGLTHNDARRLARAAIVDDGAITESDLAAVMQAKYQLMSRNDLLAFEFETSRFSDLAGMKVLKNWLQQRESFFHQTTSIKGMESPKGILLLGVQGCGKSVAAKAVAGAWKVPLLRMDFGRLYNKYIGESESNIREALKTAEVMSPCVLWIDELEKGISTSENDDGTSQRILVVQAVNKVTLRVSVWARIKARFAANGPALSKKRNAESRPHRHSRRAAAQSILDCVAALGKSWARAGPMSAANALGLPCGLRLAKIDCAVAEHYLIYRLGH